MELMPTVSDSCKGATFEGDLFLSILFPHKMFKVEIIQIYGALSVQLFHFLPKTTLQLFANVHSSARVALPNCDHYTTVNAVESMSLT